MNIPVTRIISKGIRTLFTPLELKRLEKNPVEDHSSLAETIRKARGSDFTKQELEWIDKIESKRSGLLASDEVIPVDDFLTDDAQIVNTEESEIEYVRDACSASVSPSYGRLLYKLVRDYRPQKCLELGTCLGISTAFIASALSQNGKGQLVTLEGSSSRSAYAEQVLSALRLSDIKFITGPFNQTLDPLLEDYQDVDFCYIDGHHDGNATIHYFEKISVILSEGAIVVIDDITWSEDMNRAWNTIREKEEVALTVDTYMMGICIIDKNDEGAKMNPTEKQSYKIMYW
jgi:predicted O-methyltransferase YrrM